MKPNKVKCIKDIMNVGKITVGKVYCVEYWQTSDSPAILNDEKELEMLLEEEWEPVQEFQHGDPVWAWDSSKHDKLKAFYIGPSMKDDLYPHVVETERCELDHCMYMEHRKPVQKTLTEIAEAFGTTVDNFEIVEE